MVSQKNKHKFLKRGRKILFARFARVGLPAVSNWLAARSKSERLDKLSRLPVREWTPDAGGPLVVDAEAIR